MADKEQSKNNTYAKNEKVKEMKFEQAVLKVKQDTAHIFLGIEVLFLDNKG